MISDTRLAKRTGHRIPAVCFLRISFRPSPTRWKGSCGKRCSGCNRSTRASFSVTYGAGGSTRERTVRTVGRILNESRLTPAAHMTCVNATREEVDRVIDEFVDIGVKRFVALRGDPAEGVGAAYRPHPDGYTNGAETGGGDPAQGRFQTFPVSAYPEKHPESPDFATDIDMLKRKVDNGATRAITQYFFDNDLYERYVERARRAGIYIPILPGILPVHNFSQVARFSASCGAHVPSWLADRFQGLENDPQTHALVGRRGGGRAGARPSSSAG